MPFSCMCTGVTRARSRKYGQTASYPGETAKKAKLKGRMTMPLPHLGSHNRF